MLERAQGEFREIRPLKSYYLYSTLWRQESTNQWLGADQEPFRGHHSLARDAKPIALRLVALPGNWLDEVEEIEVPDPCGSGTRSWPGPHS